MKKLVVLAAVMAAFIVAGQAYAGGSCCPMGAKKKDASSCSSYLSGIELSAEQKDKIAKIEEDCKAKGSSPEACKDSMTAIRDVLTDDQRASFDAAAGKSSKKEGCGS